MTARILVADDEPDLETLIQQKFRHQIRDGAVSFLFVRDGIEALSVLEANQDVDLVVTDINMPRMDGLTLLQKLQQTEGNLSTIIVSAYGDIANIRTAMNRGAFDFLTKPIDFLDFETTIAKTVRHVEVLREARRRQAENQQLESASHNKSQFLANMSHDLRTPLNAIIGVTEMLREDAHALNQDTEPLDRVLGAGRHLLALINDILDLSKIEAGRMELHLDTFALAPLIEDVVKTIEPLAAKSANRVVVACDGAIEGMHADQMGVRQALLNLISNANKFTDRGTIAINARRQKQNGRDWIAIAVGDTGIGMTAEQMGRLFQEFSQAGSTTASKYGGTGLGLAISRRFCQMMGGDIAVASEPGRGSIFTIRLPRIVEGPEERVAVGSAGASGTGVAHKADRNSSERAQ